MRLSKLLVVVRSWGQQFAGGGVYRLVEGDRDRFPVSGCAAGVRFGETLGDDVDTDAVPSLWWPCQQSNG
jgi:hypothetical protein